MVFTRHWMWIPGPKQQYEHTAILNRYLSILKPENPEKLPMAIRYQPRKQKQLIYWLLRETLNSLVCAMRKKHHAAEYRYCKLPSTGGK